MAKHPSIIEISKWTDGMLSGRLGLAVDNHLSVCSECHQRQGAFAAVKLDLSRLPIIEGSWVKQPELALKNSPRFPRLGWSGVLVGLVVGVLATALLKSNSPANMRVISTRPVVTNSEGLIGNTVGTNSALQAIEGGEVDLEMPGGVLLRLKPGTTMTWDLIKPNWGLGRQRMVVNLMRGEVLARTKDKFWGSRLELRTPTAMTMVKGTAFSLKVEPKQEATTVKVLTGSVFFSPHLKHIGVEVKAGHQSRIAAHRLPDGVQDLSIDERKQLLETYQIGDDSVAALVIGVGPSRAEELLNGGLLHLSKKMDGRIHPYLRKKVELLNGAIMGGDSQVPWEAMRVLEKTMEYSNDKHLMVPLQLFAGACWVRFKDPALALLHFRRVAERYPDHPLASLAWAAIGLTARDQGDLLSAREAFERIVKDYPRSPEAVLAREFLQGRSK